MSPVIILGLLLMWAVVLVPMWLRRHDEVDQTRSVDKFSAAMHTLSRGEDRPAQHNLRTSHQSAPVLDVHVSGASAPESVAERRRHRQARRRSRLIVLLVAAAISVLVVGLVIGGAAIWAAQGALDVAVLFYFAHLRRMAVQAAAVRRRAAARRRDNAELDELEREPIHEPVSDVRVVSAASRYDAPPTWEEGITVIRPGAARTPSSPAPAARTQMPALAPAAAELDDFFDQATLADELTIDESLAADFDEAIAVVASPPVPQVRVAANDGFFDQDSDSDFSVAAISVPERVEQVELAVERTLQPEHSVRAARAAAAAAAEVEAVGGKPWDPIPVPRPTYAMKPAAPSYPPVPQRSEPVMPPVKRTAEFEADDDLEAILDRRWAVND